LGAALQPLLIRRGARKVLRIFRKSFTVDASVHTQEFSHGWRLGQAKGNPTPDGEAV